MSKLTFESSRFFFGVSEMHSCHSSLSLVTCITRVLGTTFVRELVRVYPVLEECGEILLHHRDLVKAFMAGYDLHFVPPVLSEVDFWTYLLFDVCVSHEDSSFIINVHSRKLASDYALIHTFIIPFSSYDFFLSHPIVLIDFLRNSEDECEGND